MFEIDKKKMGLFIATLRKSKSMTQKQLAEYLYVSDKAVSKWETGSSIPDTSLLIPLSKILDVTVTELLMCEKMEKNQSIDSERVEDIVKTAIKYSEDDQKRMYSTKSKWFIIYPICVIISIVFLCLNYFMGYLDDNIITFVILAGGFGVYFCFFAKQSLPKYYDENRISSVGDGIIRMNMAGISFNNRNWPHIMNVCKLWSCIMLIIVPVICFMIGSLNSQYLYNISSYIYLVLLLGGLFIPIFAVGKKYE